MFFFFTQINHIIWFDSNFLPSSQHVRLSVVCDGCTANQCCRGSSTTSGLFWKYSRGKNDRAVGCGFLGYLQGRIIHRRDWASALGNQPIGGHQVIKIMTRRLKYILFSWKRCWCIENEQLRIQQIPKYSFLQLWVIYRRHMLIPWMQC